MPMVNTKEMFKKAYEGGYAIGAFNVNNMEIIQGITEGAKMENAPLILQVSKGARAYAKHVYLMKMIEAAIEDTDLPIVVHLDHGPDFETCKSCIDGGFTCVMIDGSHLPFEENIALTKKVVEYAHMPRRTYVTVEAELGRLAGVEDDVKVSAEDSSYTHPDEVEEFVTRTGCDSLAIAIGTSHGAFKFKGEPKLRFDILEEVWPPPARLPHRAARRFLRHSRVCGYDQPVRRSDARRSGRARGHAAQGRYHGGVQDQHRLRPASGLHRRSPQALCGASGSLRSPSVPDRRPRRHPQHGAPQDRGRAGLQRQGLIGTPFLNQHSRPGIFPGRFFYCKIRFNVVYQ